jgi:uncharacterized protein (TIGR02145 family)
MKRLFHNLLFMVIILPSFLISQTIKGKLVDVNGNGLSGYQLNLYIRGNYLKPIVYSATSGSDGSFTFKNVLEVKEEKLPIGYSVSENFPNPFNPKTRIFITLPNSSNVKVNIYNILGQKVLPEMDKYFNAGTSYIDLELKGLPNGIYLANISIDEKYKVLKKIILLYGSQHLNTSVVTEPNISSLPNILSKTSSSVSIDSLVVTGSSINKIEYINLPSYAGVTLNLGSFLVNTACKGIPTVTYAGQTYHTVQIGTQCWLRENLNVGTMIDSTNDQTNNNIIEKYCYHDSPDSCTKYGGLYQWGEALQYQNGATDYLSPKPAFTGNVQGICPSGWHVPTINEFQTLANKVNNNGNALKAVGQGIKYQNGTDGRGTNTSGFSALLAGARLAIFYYLGMNVIFWSSNDYSGNSYDGEKYCYGMSLSYNYNDIEASGTENTFKAYGNTVRCLKD